MKQPLAVVCAALALWATAGMAIEPAPAQSAAVSAIQAQSASGTIGRPAPVDLEHVEGSELVSLDGQIVGRISEVVHTADGGPHVVVGVGGFLGFGGKDVLVPVARLRGQSDGIVGSSLTADQIHDLPERDDD